jgi:hypothetical protein
VTPDLGGVTPSRVAVDVTLSVPGVMRFGVDAALFGHGVTRVVAA